jgi:hypothetical protein
VKPPVPGAGDAVAADEAEAASDREAGDEARSPARRRVRPRRFARIIGATIATLAALTALIDWVVGKISDHPPAKVAAHITSVERQSRLSLGDHLEQVGDPRAGRTPAELRQVGDVFVVAMRITGEQGNRLTLRWFMVDADTGARLRHPGYTQEPAIFQPRTVSQERDYPVWIPPPPGPGRYTITFALVNTAGEPVDQETASLTVTQLTADD